MIDEYRQKDKEILAKLDCEKTILILFVEAENPHSLSVEVQNCYSNNYPKVCSKLVLYIPT